MENASCLTWFHRSASKQNQLASADSAFLHLCSRSGNQESNNLWLLHILDRSMGGSRVSWISWHLVPGAGQGSSQVVLQNLVPGRCLRSWKRKVFAVSRTSRSRARAHGDGWVQHLCSASVGPPMRPWEWEGVPPIWWPFWSLPGHQDAPYPSISTMP